MPVPLLQTRCLKMVALISRIRAGSIQGDYRNALLRQGIQNSQLAWITIDYVYVKRYSAGVDRMEWCIVIDF